MSVQCDNGRIRFRGYVTAIRGCQTGLVSCKHDPGFSNENPVKNLFSTGSKACLYHLTPGRTSCFRSVYIYRHRQLA